MFRRMRYVSLCILLFAEFSLADVTMNLVTSSCTQGIGQATLNGYWSDGLVCNANANYTVQTAQCTAQYPAAQTWRTNNPTCYCITTETLASTTTYSTGCEPPPNGRFTSPTRYFTQKCYHNP